MLEQMIESKNNRRETTRRGEFLFVTFGVFAAVLVSGWTYSLFAKSFGVGGEDFEISSLVSPVQVADQAPPKRPDPPKAETSKTSNKVVLKDFYEEMSRSAPPKDLFGKKEVISVRDFDPRKITRGDANLIPENAGRSSGNATNDCGLCGKTNDPKVEPEDKDFDNVQVKAKPTPQPKQRPTVSLGPVNGKATYLPKPNYSAAAISVRASGTVEVQVTIDETGRVISASAVSGHPLLRGSAVDAARISRFTPTTLGGVPVKVTGIIIYNFVPR